jgi:ergothioneine biosynthesis protein EgtB
MQPRGAASGEGPWDPESLCADYRRTRAQTERLCEPLEPEDFLIQTVPEASPTRWHLAHTAWFFETFLLRPYLPGYRVFHAGFDSLFNSYYEGTGTGFWPRAERGMLSRPTLAQVFDYRRHVDAGMESLIGREGLPERETVAARTAIGINHEQQHQELLLTDIKRNLAHNPLRPAYRRDLPLDLGRDPGPVRYLEHEGGVQTIGATGPGFAWDNEHPRHQVYLRPYALADRLVTNAEYLEFVADGGYRSPALWLADGWARVRAEGWQAPLYWEPSGDGWQVVTLGGLRALDPGGPVCHLSWYEAAAFAAWSGRRLPTEAEWEHAAAALPVSGNCLESGWLHPRPAQPGPAGLRQVFGDCWEWTASAYLPYPGYRAPAGALGEYNGKFMANQMVLRGGSCASPAGHLRASCRNFFYPHERWQFMGLRLADDRP